MSQGLPHVASEAKTILFVLILAIAWAVMPMCALSTWRHRRSLYVRVRQPVWLLIDIALLLAVITLISVKELLMARGQDMPCLWTDAAAAAIAVWLPSVMLCRSLDLWYASTITTIIDMKVDRIRLQKRFHFWLIGGLLCLGLTGVRVAASAGSFCPSTICHEYCYWGTQYVLLLPLGGLLAIASAFTWEASLRVQGLERLGLRTEFRRLNMLIVPTIGFAMTINVSMDFGVLSPMPFGHTMASGCWILAYMSRFVALHVLPSVTYGYSPRNCLRRCLCPHVVRKIAPLQPAALQAPLLPSRAAMSSPEIEQVNLTYSLQALPDAPPQGSGGQSNATVRSPMYEVSAYEMASVTLPDDGASFSSTSPRSSSSQASDAGRPSGATAHSPPPGVFLPRLMVAVPISTMSLQDILDAGDERVLLALLGLCRMLCCEHWVLFLLALHPHLSSLNLTHQGVSRPLPRGVVASVYLLFLCPGAPLVAPVYGAPLERIREYCKLRFRQQKADILMRLSALHDPSTLQAVPDRTVRFLTRLRLLGLEDQDPVDVAEEEGTATSITDMLHRAYCEVRDVVSAEVLPLFQAYVEMRGLEGGTQSGRHATRRRASSSAMPSSAASVQESLQSNSSLTMPWSGEDSPLALILADQQPHAELQYRLCE